MSCARCDAARTELHLRENAVIGSARHVVDYRRRNPRATARDLRDLIDRLATSVDAELAACEALPCADCAARARAWEQAEDTAAGVPAADPATGDAPS